MSGIREAIRAFVLADPKITALIGNRLYSIVVPEAETQYPAVAYQVVSAIGSHHKSGATGFRDTRFQFSVIAARHSEAVAVVETLRACLDGFRGDMNGVYVHQIRADTETDMYEQAAGLYVVTIDFIVLH